MPRPDLKVVETVAAEGLEDNPFAAAGLPDADVLLRKHNAVERIEEELRRRGLTERELSRMAGVDPQELSIAMRRQLDKARTDVITAAAAALGLPGV